MNKKYLSRFLKHQTIIIAVSLIAVILITGSVSHAYFTASVKGNPTSVKATSGDLNITFSNTATNSSSKIYIQSDSGSNAKQYTLTVKNAGNVKAGYDIVVENKSSSTLSSSNIKYQIYKQNTSSSSAQSLSSSNSNKTKIIHVTSIAANATDTYILKVWVSSSLGESSQNSVLSSSKSVNLEVKVVSKASAVSSQLSSIS